MIKVEHDGRHEEYIIQARYQSSLSFILISNQTKTIKYIFTIYVVSTYFRIIENLIMKSTVVKSYCSIPNIK